MTQAHDERRLRRVFLGRDYLTRVLLGGDPSIREVTSDMPADAKVEYTKDAANQDGIVAYVSSMEWEPLEPGAFIPEFFPTYTVVAR